MTLLPDKNEDEEIVDAHETTITAGTSLINTSTAFISGPTSSITWNSGYLPGSQYTLFPQNPASNPIVKINTSPNEENLISFYDKSGTLIVRILVDGTVQIHKLGAEPEVAKTLYEAIELHGIHLHKKIELLETQLKIAKNAFTNINNSIQSTDTNPKAINIKNIASDTLDILK